MAGRKSKYDEIIAPNLSKIEEWTKSGATEKEICTALKISTSTFYAYKRKHSELSRALRVGRTKVVLEIKAALLKKALGYEYTETKGVNKGGAVTQMEVYKRHMPPDPTAAAMLLRNYDEEWRDKDNTINEFKRQEIELKKAIAEAQNFDLNNTSGEEQT